MSLPGRDPIAAFRDAMAQAGLRVEQIIPDGEIHRFKGPNEKRKDSYYALHLNNGPPRGVFGSWHGLKPQKWSAKAPPGTSRAEWRRQLAAARDADDEASKRRHERVAAESQKTWQDLEGNDLDPAKHPYVLAKRIVPYGARVDGDNNLVIPVRRAGTGISSLQRIRPNGDKLFEQDGAVSGCFAKLILPSVKGPPTCIFIPEGWATGCTILEAAAISNPAAAVAPAFSAYNLKGTAVALHKKYPEVPIVICPDDDWRTEAQGKGNAGITEGFKAAVAVGGRIVVPRFPEREDPEGKARTDFNDLHLCQGLAEVTRQLAMPKKPAEIEAERAQQGQQVASDDANPLIDKDLAVADRILKHHRGDMIWSPATGFLIWDGLRWKPDDRESAEKIADEVVRGIYVEAAAQRDAELRGSLWELASKQSTAPRIEGALRLARRHVAVSPDDLDRHPYFLNVLNGTIDLRTSILHPHRREDRITKLIPIEYSPMARAPRWYQFLMEVFADDQRVCEYVKRSAGYSLTGEQRDQCFWVLWGTGENGKTTFVERILELAGPYGQTAAASLFLLDRGGRSNNDDEARLRGIRFVAASENAETRVLDEAKIKKLTGDERISASFKYKDIFEFDPTHHLWLSTNDKPAIRGTNRGIWRRVKLIPFSATFEDPKEHPDTQHPKDFQLKEKLSAELPGILAWAVEGAREWYEHGLDEPDSVRAATKGYKREQDLLQDFIEERCQIDPARSAASAILYTVYVEWAKGAGLKPWAKTRFGRRLRDMGFEDSRENNHSWRGLDLKGVV